MKYHNTIESNTQYTCDIMYTSEHIYKRQDKICYNTYNTSFIPSIMIRRPTKL